MEYNNLMSFEILSALGNVPISPRKKVYERYDAPRKCFEVKLLDANNGATRALASRYLRLSDPKRFLTRYYGPNGMAHWMSVLTKLRPLANSIDEMAPSPYLSWGRKALDTFTGQFQYAPFWFVENAPYVNDRPIDSRLESAIRTVIRFCALNCKPAASHGVRRGTNHGFPDWRKDDVSLAYHTILASLLVSEMRKGAPLNEALKSIERYTGPQTFYGSTIFRRSGPRSKPIPLMRVRSSGAVEQLGTTTNVFCRSRHVFGIPTFINLSFYPYYDKTVSFLRSLALWHDGSFSLEDDIVRRERKIVYSQDASSFDHSISRDMIRVIAEALSQTSQFKGWASEVVRHIADIPLITGGDCTSRLAVAPHKGGLPSGFLGTTFIDCIVSVSLLVVLISEETGWTYLDVLRKSVEAGDINFLAWGDDNIIFSDRHIDTERWNSTAKELGFDVSLEKEYVFLQGYGSKRFSSFGRLLQQDLANEHVPNSQYMRVFTRDIRLALASNLPDGMGLWLTDAFASLDPLPPLTQDVALTAVRLAAGSDEGLFSDWAVREGNSSPFMLRALERVANALGRSLDQLASSDRLQNPENALIALSDMSDAKSFASAYSAELFQEDRDECCETET